MAIVEPSHPNGEVSTKPGQLHEAVKNRRGLNPSVRTEASRPLASLGVTTMEAQGIEPWSESASGNASTCVGFDFSLISGPFEADHPETDLRWSSCPVVEDYLAIVRIFDPMPAPRTGSEQRRSVNRA